MRSENGGSGPVFNLVDNSVCFINAPAPVALLTGFSISDWLRKTCLIFLAVKRVINLKGNSPLA